MRVTFVSDHLHPSLDRQRAEDAKVCFPDGSALRCGSRRLYVGRDLSAERAAEFRMSMAYAFVRAAMTLDPLLSEIKDGAFVRGETLKPIEIGQQIASILNTVDRAVGTPYGDEFEDTIVIKAATRAQATDIAAAIVELSPRTKVTGAPSRPEPMTTRLKAKLLNWIKNERLRRQSPEMHASKLPDQRPQTP